MKLHVFGFYDEFKAIIHVADDLFSISYCHNENSFPPRGGPINFFLVLKMTQFFFIVLMTKSIGLEFVKLSCIFMSRSLSIYAALISLRLSFLYSSSNLMVT
jgi:hypothetical protein